MRGLETMRTRPLVSAALRRRLRLKLLSIDPSERPMAPPDPVPTAADADVAHVVARGLDDARLDEHLRRLRVERANQLFDAVQVAGDVARDDRIGALVDRDGPARREQVARARLDLVGLGVADLNEPHLERHEVELGPLLRDPELALLLELGERRHADQVPRAHHPEPLGREDDVEPLIPRDVVHPDRHAAGHVVRGDDVHVPDVGEEPEDAVDVRALEVEVDAASAVRALLLGAQARGEPGLTAEGGLDLSVVVHAGLHARDRRERLVALDGHRAIRADGDVLTDADRRAHRAIERPDERGPFDGDDPLLIADAIDLDDRVVVPFAERGHGAHRAAHRAHVERAGELLAGERRPLELEAQAPAGAGGHGVRGDRAQLDDDAVLVPLVLEAHPLDLGTAHDRGGGARGERRVDARGARRRRAGREEETQRVAVGLEAIRRLPRQADDEASLLARVGLEALGEHRRDDPVAVRDRFGRAEDVGVLEIDDELRSVVGDARAVRGRSGADDLDLRAAGDGVGRVNLHVAYVIGGSVSAARTGHVGGEHERDRGQRSPCLRAHFLGHAHAWLLGGCVRLE